MKISSLCLVSSLFLGSVHGAPRAPPTHDVDSGDCKKYTQVTGTDTYFCMVATSVNWDTAKTSAESNTFACPVGSGTDTKDVNGRLAIPTTPAEAALMVGDFTNHWLGAKQTACTAEAGCSWSWLDGQPLPVDSDLWLQPPDDNGQNGADCGLVKDGAGGFLKDAPCTTAKNYIVEYNCNYLYADAGELDISDFFLGNPAITTVNVQATVSPSNNVQTKLPTSTAQDKLTVKFEHGKGTDSPITGKLLTAGFCPDGDELLDLDNTPGLTVDGESLTCTGRCTTEYTIDINLRTMSLDLDEDSKLYFCVTHFIVHETVIKTLGDNGNEDTETKKVVLNFQQTDVTVTYDLVTDSIIGFIFQSAKSSPEQKEIALSEILVEAIEISFPATDDGNGGTVDYYVQGELMSWDICPIDPSDMFRTAELVSLKASGNRGSGDGTDFEQYLTTASGASQDAIFSQIFQSTDNPDCLNIQFILQSDFFASFETPGGDNAPDPFALDVQVTGSVRFTEKVARRTLRAENEPRHLQTRVAESDVELKMILGATPDAKSGSYLVSVSRVSLLGADGVAALAL